MNMYKLPVRTKTEKPKSLKLRSINENKIK